MTKLSVNLNKIALLRNSRGGDQPDVLHHAKIAVAAGADGITLHPRPDCRHALAEDTAALSSLLAHHCARVELNIEGNPFAASGARGYPGFMSIVRQAAPHQCTLVPDAADQVTSNRGFDLRRNADRLRPVIAELKSLEIRSSLFMEPEPEQIELAAALGVDRIELYTGPYAEGFSRAHAEDRVSSARLAAIVEPYARASAHARTLGLGVNAGHDLNQRNLGHFLKSVDPLEVSIGHALVCEALEAGFVPTIRRYRALVAESGD